LCGVADEDHRGGLRAELAFDARSQPAEQERHARAFGGRPGRGRNGVAANQQSADVAVAGQGREAVEQAPVGAVMGPGWAIEGQVRSRFGGLAMDRWSGNRFMWPRMIQCGGTPCVRHSSSSTSSAAVPASRWTPIGAPVP
jgi:hypothetical protein